MSVVFDKLGVMRHLESDGTFARPQAEKLTEAFHQAIEETVPTREDIIRLEARIVSMEANMDGRMGSLEAKLDGRMGSLEAKLDGRMGSLEAKLEGRMGGLEAKLDGRIDSLEAKLDGRMGGLEAKLEASLAQMKVWIAGVGVALFTALSATRFFGH